MWSKALWYDQSMSAKATKCVGTAPKRWKFDITKKKILCFQKLSLSLSLFFLTGMKHFAPWCKGQNYDLFCSVYKDSWISSWIFFHQYIKMESFAFLSRMLVLSVAEPDVWHGLFCLHEGGTSRGLSSSPWTSAV